MTSTGNRCETPNGCNSAVHLACMGADDCPAGQKCCLDGKSAVCKATCTGTEQSSASS